jgi:putative peptidoglycan lipid II flippase
MAVATAILPALARHAADERRGGSLDGFHATLASGMRLVLLLTLPAAAGLLVLADPLVALLFQHGEFDALDTFQTARALRFYLIGMVFAAVDQPLVFAFYARNETTKPALVGILGVGIYLLVALPTMRALGMLGLILANDAQLAGHAAVMIGLYRREVGSLRGHGVGRALVVALTASVAMGLVVYAVTLGIGRLVPGEGPARWGATVLVGGGAGLGAYWALCAAFSVSELSLLRPLLCALTRRLRRDQPPGDGGT